MKGSDKWHVVEEKLEELRRLVEENWDKEEWELAVLGESTIRTVGQSKMDAAEMRERFSEYIKSKWLNCDYHEGRGSTNK